MLKKSLLVIVVATIGLVFAGNTFGQENRSSAKRKATKRNSFVIPVDTTGWGSVVSRKSATLRRGQGSKTKHPRRRSTQKLGNFEIQDFKANRTRTKSQTSSGDQPELQRRKRPRSHQKRQYKPLSF